MRPPADLEMIHLKEYFVQSENIASSDVWRFDLTSNVVAGVSA